MLTSSTKRKIDNARDILVGKIPMPTTQVEQITLALIYKFMSDIDKKSKALGDTSGFFANGYEKYAWDKLMDKSISARDRVALYSEGLEEMSKNPHIPQLFRDIFKNAFLPFRSPETLKLFLEQIDEFEYDHSEELGNAFEYLLSVMGSQGDAGQFRTPRHIIDFIIKVVDPSKTDTILDPACGTAGFLISAYKHIKSKGLSAQEQKKLTNNFVGYDISHEMQRLAMVNMYLHHFPDPHIYEYDTLSSEDRWDDDFDVILANPPFMTPKGGIRPHSRFSVQSKKAEVLFTDYIMEHLNINGKAGVIVPEGIVFHTQNAFRSLRKMMIEDNYLWAVVSLPSGVFNPYSGVKTSILFFDKQLAKKTDKVLFVKIENDGFDLGAQRREIKTNDLPNALKILQSYKKIIIENKELKLKDDNFAHLVKKSKIIESGDWSLNNEKYKELITYTGDWNLFELGKICEIQSGSRQKGGALNSGIPSIGGSQITKNGSISLKKMKYISESHFNQMKKGVLKSGDVLLVKDGATTGKVGIYFGQFKKAAVNEHVYILRPSEKIIPNFLYEIIKSDKFQKKLKRYIKGIIGGINFEIKEIKIPIPPISIQQEISRTIGGYRNIIDGVRQIVENHQPSFETDKTWKIVRIEEIILGKPTNGYSGKPVKHKTNIKVLSLSATSKGFLDSKEFKYLDENLSKDFEKRCKRGDIYLQRGNTRELVGMPAVFDIKDDNYIFPDLMIRIRADEKKVLTDFLYFSLLSNRVRNFIKRNANGSAGSMPKINQSIVNSIPIILPPLPIQKKIVASIRSEIEIIKANLVLIEKFEEKIEEKIESVWRK
ncbi:MAG: N-6 DNA methylase [Patescibacteria group bacterium]